MKKVLTILAVASLAACSVSDDSGYVTTNKHILFAQEKCKNNDGVSSIVGARVAPEMVECGSKCWRDSGKKFLYGKVVCNNGAEFKVNIKVNEMGEEIK